MSFVPLISVDFSPLSSLLTSLSDTVSVLVADNKDLKQRLAVTEARLDARDNVDTSDVLYSAGTMVHGREIGKVCVLGVIVSNKTKQMTDWMEEVKIMQTKLEEVQKTVLKFSHHPAMMV